MPKRLSLIFICPLIAICCTLPVTPLPFFDDLFSAPLNILNDLLNPLTNIFSINNENSLVPNIFGGFLDFSNDNEPQIDDLVDNFPNNQFSNILENFIPRSQSSQSPEYFINEGNFARSANSENTPSITPLFGSIHKTAYFFVDGIIGSDFQRQSLIIDTGSSVLAAACDRCVSCGQHLDEPFRCSASSGCYDIPCKTSCSECRDSHLCSHCVNKCPICSSDGISCAYDVHYAEGSSITGSWHLDHFYFPQYDNPSSLSEPILTPIGCHHAETNLFLDQAASGILGLQYSTMYGPRTFLDSALDKFSKKQMSICLAEEGGLMALGRALHEYHKPTSSSPLEPPYITWIARVPLQRSYQVHLLSIQIADSYPITVSRMSEFFNLFGIRRYATLDSGTTLTYLPFDIYNPLMTAFHDFLNKNKRVSSLKEINRRLNQVDKFDEDIAYKNFRNFDSSLRNLDPLYSETILEIPFDKLNSTFPQNAKPRHIEEIPVSGKQASCWYLPNGDSDLKEFPIIKMNFESYKNAESKSSTFSTIEWHPGSYLYSRGSPNRRCLSIESHTQILLGATFFINKDITFDYDDTQKIGIAEANCPNFQYDDRYSF